MLLEIVKETSATSSTSWVFTTYDISVSYVVDGELLGVVDVFEEKSPAFSSKLADEGYYFVAGVTCDEIVNAPGLRYSILGVPENIRRPRRSLRQWLKTRRSTSDDTMEVARVSDAVIRVIRQLALSSCDQHDVKMLKKHRHLVEPTRGPCSHDGWSTTSWWREFSGEGPTFSSISEESLGGGLATAHLTTSWAIVCPDISGAT